MTLRSLLWILLLAALGLGLWWARGEPRLAQVLNQTLGLPAEAASPAPQPAPATTLRKCRGAGSVVYTDADCPAGTRAERVEGGSLTVLPAPPSARPAAASAVPPLRRLAGPDESAAQRERVLDQALQR